MERQTPQKVTKQWTEKERLITNDRELQLSFEILIIPAAEEPLLLHVSIKVTAVGVAMFTCCGAAASGLDQLYFSIQVTFTSQ